VTTTVSQPSAAPEFAPRRVPLSNDEPATLVEVIERLVRVHRRDDALNHKRDGQWHAISSDEMLARMRRIAAGLYSYGVRPGDRVALLSESRLEWTLTDGGCLFSGAISVPIYPTLTPPQVRYVLEDSGANVLAISGWEKFLMLAEIVKACAKLHHVVFFDKDGAGTENVMTLADLEESGRALEVEQPDLIDVLAHNTKPEDLATIIYTSGTTGEPKGVMLTHSNLVSNLIDMPVDFSFGESDIALSVLPLSHVLERQAMYMYLHHGIAVYFAESFDQLGRNMREAGPTVFVGVPRIFEKIYASIRDRAAAKGRLSLAMLSWAVAVATRYAMLLTSHQKVPRTLVLRHKLAARLVFSKWRDGLGGRLRLFISGGAALSEEIGYVFLGAGLPIVQGYGLTETSPVITANAPDCNRIGTVGRPIRNVAVRIASDGEIEVRGPNVMRGYWNKPEETRAAFTDDGWFKTGDIGAIDADGFLRITDRKKDLFKTSGGKYVAPQPIEQMIKGSSFVNQVVVIGDGRKFPAALIVPEWERLHSYVELKGLKARTREELCHDRRIIDLFERQIAARTTNLAQYENVKRFALLEHELTIESGELTPTLKVRRRVIEEKYRAVIDRLYQ
jgi:long-chain acyl-CoA synthetase